MRRQIFLFFLPDLTIFITINSEKQFNLFEYSVANDNMIVLVWHWNSNKTINERERIIWIKKKQHKPFSTETVKRRIQNDTFFLFEESMLEFASWWSKYGFASYTQYRRDESSRIEVAHIKNKKKKKKFHSLFSISCNVKFYRF